jgi:hypothetical protein
VVPRSALYRALAIVRQIRQTVQPGATVLEIGPGSGYVGALLLTMGYRYIAHEVTQGFYIWQSRLFDALRGAFLDLAPDGQPFCGPGPFRAVHIPWWHWFTPHFPYEPAIVTANHCLTEMHPAALAFAAQRVAKLGAPLVNDGWGGTGMSAEADVAMILRDAGVKLFNIPSFNPGGAALTHTLADCDAMLREISGRDDLMTADEKFMALAGEARFS